MSKIYFIPQLRLLFTLLFLLTGVQIFAQVETYNAASPGTGTWVCPAGVTSVTVETWGGGGGGGYGRGISGAAGGGGGGGGYSKSLPITVVPGTTYYYTYGTPGTQGNPVGPIQGGNGGTSCFSTGANCTGTIFVSASGGIGGLGANTNTSAAGGAGGIGSDFNGGAGANGVNGAGAAFGGGGGGGGASTTSAGGNASGKTGGTGGTVGGGNGGNGVASSFTQGGSIGGGGSGGHKYTANIAGAPGGSGQIRFTYAVPACTAPAQATTFVSGTRTSTTFPASFSGTASGYLVVRSLTPAAPTQPVNGTMYSAGNVATLGAAFSFVQSGASTSIAGAGLTGNTQYYYFIYAFNNAFCSGGPIYNTTGALTGNGRTCPEVPNAVGTSGITNSTFSINWTLPTGGTTNYTVQVTTDAGYTANIPGSPFTVTAPTTTLNISGLSSGTMYYYRILAGNGCSSAYVNGSATTASGTYCAATTTDTFGDEYIQNFTTTGGFLNIVNTTGFSPAGYGSYTGQAVSQIAGQNVNFSSTYMGGTHQFSIYIDWNNDLDFADANETAYSSTNYQNGHAGTFAAPVGTPQGSYRMRIRANWLGAAMSCGAITYGEAEDYTFTVAAPLPCATYPTALSIGTVTATTAVVSWTAPAPAPASGYQFYYSTSATAPLAGTTPSGSTAAGITTTTLSGLTANTTYYFWVRSNCNAVDKGAWVGPISFFSGYCSATSSGSAYYINDFITNGGILNITNNNTGFSPTGYGNYTGMSVTQNAGQSIGFSASFYDGSFYSYGCNIWVDWNNDMDFNDAGERVYASGAYVISASGSFTVPAGAAMGNYRMRVRADYLATNPSACGTISSGETEDYTLTVAAPLPCSSNPTNLSANINSASSVTISWTETTPYPANGYNYYYATSSTNPVAATTPSGSTAFGVTTATISPLTAGTTYYYWVRANCGGGLGVGSWIGPQSFFIPTCGVGNSTGTTTLGCHNVVSGGLGLSGGDVAPIDCVSGTCVNLEATYLNVAEPTSYTVSNIPYAPPYQFNCLKNPVSVNNDDVWSPVVTLPFNFCFYGNNYSQCIISSNGVISFDMVNNQPGGASAWPITTNLPNTGMFRNAIFGVYHDIYPTLGGEVGWELVTLNSGCRALVAAWNNIPMFSCTAQTYTGMMVLYENTNIIDVYVQQKNVCATWNSGNAVIGIQNAAGTTAVVPPNRNSLDADWTVTNEAWRFTPSGASTTTIKWYEGAGTAGPIVGTTNTINVCPSSTTIYTAEITYSLCSSRTISYTDQTTVAVNANKTWNGSISTDWNNGTNWTPSGVPTNLQCVLIPPAPRNCVISGAAYNAYAHNVTVQSGGVLRVDPTNNNITVTDAVNVNTGGQFNIMNSGGLIQVNNTPNTGAINMTRITPPMYRYDYTYWGTPVTLASNYTLGNLSPTTQPDKYYSWTPYIGSSFGTWNQESAATFMDPRKGYIVRAPQTYSMSPATKVPYTAVFTGTPNNGIINAPVLFGAVNLGVGNYNNKYNLLGNPYPSSISAAAFLNLLNNQNVIDGTIYFWTHNSAISAVYPDPFYNDFLTNYSATDYASWNRLGPVGTEGTAAASGGAIPNGFIGAGQGFFVRSKSVAGGNAIFNNGMRSNLYSNTQFYRPGENAETTNVVNNDDNFEKHRIWLNLTNPVSFSQILIGYAEGATMGYDSGLDGVRFNSGNSVNFYSIITGEDMLAAQGRPLPFNTDDQVPLGYISTMPDNFSIRIDHLDGEFENQNVYLEDKLLNVIHDLKQSPYVFASAVGRFDDRFVLRYTDSFLTNDAFETSGLSAFIHDRKFHVAASESIHTIEIYELNGKLVKTYQPASKVKSIEDDFIFAQGVYFAKIKLEGGNVVTQKLMNK